MYTYANGTQEAQQVWEEERAMLKRGILEASAAAAAAAHTLPPLPLPPVFHPTTTTAAATTGALASPSATPAQVSMLKQRVLDLESEVAELGKRARHLESHLREREKLLVKADKRYQELSRFAAIQCHTVSALPG
jgi:hypothetical protein